MAIESLPQFIQTHYEIYEWRHASAILQHDFTIEYADICDVLSRFRLKKSFITTAAGESLLRLIG